MANLGTLWFGADIDLTALKQKINQGNQSVLDALKMNYDSTSYTQMVNKLKTQLAREEFHINVTTNVDSVAQSVRQTLNNISGGNNGQISLFDTQNIQSAQNGVTGIHRQVVDFTRKILDQKDVVKEVANDVAVLRDRWGSLLSRNGRRNADTMAAYQEYINAKKVLREEQTALFALQQGRSRANLTLAEQRVAYKEANELVRQAREHLVQEKQSRIEATAAYEREKTARKAVQTQLEAERRKAAELRVEQAKQNVTRLQSQQAMRQQTQETRQLNSDSIRLNTTLANGIHISTRLGSALSSLFAVHYARQFLDNVIEIGGQLEKQRISMGAILQDTARANVLFEQIKELAIKSPFGVVELDQYSKQLAAYGIEQSNLFGMTKRLADISAGAGQDIGRLALALGHVKSATYLTGITLRQFSMNNIPMLKMLADYYTEVEKRAVSTAEVQKRISQRQVSYEDVLEQIKRMTDEGGMFYNMQEKISESLQAKYKNLRDSFDIMYGEMAESGVGDALKALAAALTQMSRHWKELFVVMSSGLAVWGSYRMALAPVNAAFERFGRTTVLTSVRLNAQKIALGASASALRSVSAASIQTMVQQGLLTKEQLLGAVATKRLTVAQAELAAAYFNVSKAELVHIANMGKAGILMRSLTVGARSLGIALKGIFMNPFTWILTGVMAVAEVFMNLKNKSEEAKQAVADTMNAANEGYENIQQTLQKFPKEAPKGNIGGSIAELSEAIRNYAPNAASILNEASALESLEKRYKYLREQLEETKQAYADMASTADVVTNANEATGNIFNDTLKENIEDYIDALHEASKAEDELLDHRVSIYKALENISNSNSAFAASRRNADGSLKSMRDQVDILQSLGVYESFRNILRDIDMDAANAMYNWRSAMESADEVLEREVMPDLEDFVKRLDSAYIEAWGNEWLKSGAHVKTSVKEVTDFLDKIPNMTDKVKNKLLDEIFNKRWHLNIDFNVQEATNVLTGWQKEMQDYFNEKGIHIRLSMESSREDVIKQIAEERKKMQAIADNSGKVLIGIGFKLDKLPSTLPAPLNTPWNQQNLIDNKESNDALKSLDEAIKKYNLNVKEEKKKNTTSGTKTDEELNNWKKRIQLLEKYRQELEKLEKLMTRSEAEAKLREEGNFSSLWKFGDPNDYNSFLLGAISALGTKGERGNYVNELKAKISDNNLKDFTKDTEDATRELKNMLTVVQENYQTYKKWMELTGDARLSSQIAGVTHNSSYKDFLRNKYNENPVSGMTAETFFGLSESEARKFGEKSGLFVLWEEWEKNNKKLREENLKLYEEAIKDSKGYEDQIADINRQLEKEISAIRELGGDESLVENATKKAAGKISALKWKEFKSSDDYVRIFSNLDKVSNYTLRRMIERLRELKPDIDADAASIKALYEALEKAESKLLSRDPFKEMGKAVKNIKTLKKALGDSKIGAPVSGEAAKIFGVKDGTYIQQSEFLDKILEEREKVFKELKDWISGLETVFNKLGSILDGFAGKLMSSMGSMMGSVQSGLAGAKEGGFSGWAQAAMSAVSIIETGVKLLDDTSDGFADEVKKINKVTDALYGMRDAIREAGQEAKTWFNDEGLIGLKNDMQDNIDALDKYNAKLYEVQGKYQNASSGLSKTWGAIAGGVTGAIEGALTGVIFGPVGAAAGLVIGSAVGTAVGIGVQKGVEAGVKVIFPDHNNTEYAKDNLRVQTQHRTFFRSEKTQDLQSWINENMADKAAALGIKSLQLFDAQGMINKELAQAVLDSGANLVGETRETLETLIKYKEEYDEYLKALHEYVENLYSPLIDNVTDAIWDAYAEGKDALDSFKNYAQDTFKDIAKDLIKSLATKYIFQNFGDEISDFYDKYLRGEISESDLNSAIGRSSKLLMGRYEEYAPKLQYALESFGKVLDYYTGIDITADAESNISEAQGTIHAAQSLSEDTGNQLVGRITATQIAVETFRVQQGAAMATSNSLLEIISQQVTLAVMHLQNISGNPNGDSNSVANDILWQQVISNQYLYDIMTSNKAIYEEWGPMIVEMRDKINTL